MLLMSWAAKSPHDLAAVVNNMPQIQTSTTEMGFYSKSSGWQINALWEHKVERSESDYLGKPRNEEGDRNGVSDGVIPPPRPPSQPNHQIRRSFRRGLLFIKLGKVIKLNPMAKSAGLQGLPAIKTFATDFAACVLAVCVTMLLMSWAAKSQHHFSF
jgi:hypothetical protein